VEMRPASCAFWQALNVMPQSLVFWQVADGSLTQGLQKVTSMPSGHAWANSNGGS